MMIENLVDRLQSISSGDLVKAIQEINLASLEKGVVISKDSQKVLDCLREARDIYHQVNGLFTGTYAQDPQAGNIVREKLDAFEKKTECQQVYNTLRGNQIFQDQLRYVEEEYPKTSTQQPAPSQQQQVASVDTVVQKLVDNLKVKDLNDIFEEMEKVKRKISLDAPLAQAYYQELFQCLSNAVEIWRNYQSSKQNQYADAVQKFVLFEGNARKAGGNVF